MAIRLGEYVVQGTLYNTSHYGTHGYVQLRGEDDDNERMFLRFEVTGDPNPDLKGKHIRFAPAEDDGTQRVMPVAEYKSINPTQHGVTGTMTAQGWVRALPCSVDEFVYRSELGEPPPTEWRQRLMLEWFGPSGRVTIEMAGPTIEYCTREPDHDDEDDEGDWEPLPNLALPPWIDASERELHITQFEITDGEVTVEERRPYDATPEEEAYLQDALDRESARIDRAIAGESDDEARQQIEDLQRMDYCMEHGEKQPFDAYIGDWSALPKPDDLDDEAVEAALKSLLARLVMYGVVLDVCDHYAPRDCYRLLLEEIIPNEGIHEELIGTGWITHYATYEYCRACDEAFDKEYEEMERSKERDEEE